MVTDRGAQILQLAARRGTVPTNSCIFCTGCLVDLGERRGAEVIQHLAEPGRSLQRAGVLAGNLV
jgi:hypothetical protein